MTTEDATYRRRRWMLQTGTRESVGAACRHGLKSGRRCSGSACWNPPPGVTSRSLAVDHGQLWIRNGERFILAHLYGTRDMVREWADSYSEWAGLDWEFGTEEDAWYGNDTIPVVYRLRKES